MNRPTFTAHYRADDVEVLSWQQKLSVCAISLGLFAVEVALLFVVKIFQGWQ